MVKMWISGGILKKQMIFQTIKFRNTSENKRFLMRSKENPQIKNVFKKMLWDKKDINDFVIYIKTFPFLEF